MGRMLTIIRKHGYKPQYTLNWTQSAGAILTPGQLVYWKAHYQEECEIRADLNRQQNIALNLERLLGTVHTQAPAQYFNQVKLCALRAFKQCSAIKTDKFTKLTQRKDEDFSTFLNSEFKNHVLRRSTIWKPNKHSLEN